MAESTYRDLRLGRTRYNDDPYDPGDGIKDVKSLFYFGVLLASIGFIVAVPGIVGAAG